MIQIPVDLAKPALLKSLLSEHRAIMKKMQQ
jgi:hypothetical protein